MNALITAGNTQTPIDDVRVITNVFTGKTGASLAAEGAKRGHRITLLTSHPEQVHDASAIRVVPYRTFDDLAKFLQQEMIGGAYQSLIHAAAVSDYALAGVYTPQSPFDDVAHSFPDGIRFADASAGKIRGSHPELWLRLVPTPKLADKVRTEWGFRGTFVKFKLEVGIDVPELERRAYRALLQSQADLIVANTFEDRKTTAYLGTADGTFTRIPREELATEIWDRVERVSNRSDNDTR
jgi:phosphopantothenate---cysteine ligase (CTP)